VFFVVLWFVFVLINMLKNKLLYFYQVFGFFYPQFGVKWILIRGGFVDLNFLWKNTLDKISSLVTPIAFETWFSKTTLIDLDGNLAKIKVPMHIYKKHLKENYDEMIKDVFNEVSGSNFLVEYITEEEFESNTFVNTDDIGVPFHNFESNLNTNYSFDNFVVGDSNRFAQATALAVSEKPGLMYNPLFIYGNSGLGKTHLMHAIGNYISKNQKKKVLYITSEKFINDFIFINKKHKNEHDFNAIESFKRKYREIDVLIIDDIQYMGSATQTQQEFFNTFNELYSNNKQIIISSDRSPDDLKVLEDRLRTRFNWGLLVNILPPDYELRKNIINKKISINGMEKLFPEDVKEFIANSCITDIRKIEGSITRVVAFATMMNGSVINVELAKEALKDVFFNVHHYKNNIDNVINVVAEHYNVSNKEIKGKKRTAQIAIPRQIAMYICREHLKEKLPRIGQEFGGKDHTTVMHSVDKINKELKENQILALEINKILDKIK
jgi:chromosomal replication initiator protein